MKIISKYKDYYDYLAGIIGIDEKLILDRTTFFPTPQSYDFEEDRIIKIHVCGYVVEVFKRGDKYYCGSLLEPLSHKPKPSRYSWLNKDLEATHYYIKSKGSKEVFTVAKTAWRYSGSKHARRTDPSINHELNCPILIEAYSSNSILHKGSHFSKFPVLKDYNIGSIFPPEEIWNMLYDWLSRTKEIPDTQTDREKIIGKGFDYKHSFRNTK